MMLAVVLALVATVAAGQQPDQTVAPSPAAPPPETPQSAADPVPPPPQDANGAKAYAVLETHCARCHQTGRLARPRPASGFGNVLDLDRLARNPALVKPGLPDGSPLYTVMLRRVMPYDAFHEPQAGAAEPTPAEIQVVRDWIQELPEPPSACPDRRRIGQDEIGEAILKALDAAGEFKARSMRFLTLAHLHNACASDADLAGYRQAVTKLVNSLSWARNPVQPAAVDPAGTVLMIDLEALDWVPQHWERLTQGYPYGMLAATRTPGRVRTLTATALPLLKADWVAAEAMGTSLYGDLLGLPQTFTELQRILGVDVAANIRAAAARRIGLRDSAVTRANRLIERHAIAAGGLWLAYDFHASQGRRNLLEHPLGPAAGAGGKPPFRHDAMRALFQLPNGFTGFALFDGQGERVDVVPSSPASPASGDVRRSDAVVNGGGCLACHAAGPERAVDELRAFTEADRTHPRDVRDGVQALHPTLDAMTSVLDGDRARTATAYGAVGVDPAYRIDGLAPLAALAAAHTARQSAARIAAELDMTRPALEAHVATLGGDQRRVGYELFQRGLSRTAADAFLLALSRPGDAAAPEKPAAAAQGEPGPVRAIELSLWTDKLRYKAGEIITVFARPTASCNLTIVSLDAAGKATVLFPNEFEPNGAVSAGQDLRLPGVQAPYQLRARDKGRETMIGICTATSKHADGIQPDYERQRFTVLGNWKGFLANALAEEAAERRNPARAAERARVRARQKGKGAAEPRIEPRTKPEVQARTAIRFEVE